MRVGVVQDFQLRAHYPLMKLSTWTVRGDEFVPAWMMGIDIAENENVWGVGQEVWREFSGSGIQGIVPDGRRVDVQERK